MGTSNRVDGIGDKFGYIMLGILFALCTAWIPNVGWVVALAWLFIGIAFATDIDKLTGIAGLVLLGLLLWFIPVIGGFLALGLVLLGAWTTYWPMKPATAQQPANQATFTDIAGRMPPEMKGQTTSGASWLPTDRPRNFTPATAAEEAVAFGSSPSFVECRVQHSTEASIMACDFHSRPGNMPRWLREERFATATWNRTPPA